MAGEFVELGDGYGCLSVARRASGAGIAAGQDSSEALNAVVRDPGGGYWSAPAVVAAASGDDWRHFTPTARSSPSRTAVTRWSRGRTPATASRGCSVADLDGAAQPGRALRGADACSPARASSTIGRWKAGVSATGEAFVLWTGPVEERSDRVMLATAAPGRAPEIAEVGRQSWASGPALAVAPDGRALVALPEREGLTVIERAPGEPFGAPVPLAATRDGVGTRASAALGPGGEAVVAWSGFSLGGVEVATRRGPGAFDPPRTLAQGNAAPPFDPYLSSFGFQLALAPDAYDFGGADPKAAMTGDGRALVSWTSRRGGLEYADVAAVPLDGSPAVAGSALVAEQYPQSVTGLTLPDGAPAVAWLGGPLQRGAAARGTGRGWRRRPAAATPARRAPGAPRARPRGPARPARALQSRVRGARTDPGAARRRVRVAALGGLRQARAASDRAADRAQAGGAGPRGADLPGGGRPPRRPAAP